MSSSDRSKGRIPVSPQSFLGGDFEEATSRLIEGLQLDLTELRRYGADDAQDTVTACEKALAEIVRQLNGVDLGTTPHS